MSLAGRSNSSIRIAFGVVVAGLSLSARAAEPAGVEFFEQKIRPVLVEHCYKCHSAEAKPAKGGLRLDSPEAFRKGGDSGAVVVAGRPDASLLVKAIRHADETLKMPPKQRLPAAVVADF